MLGRHAVAVALQERRKQLRQQRLPEHVLLVQPGRRAELRVREHRRVQPRELAQREAGVLHVAACDLVSLRGRSDVLEQDREPALLGVGHRDVTIREGTADPRRELAVEAHLALVHAEPYPRSAAVLVLGGGLQHDGRAGRPRRRAHSR